MIINVTLIKFGKTLAISLPKDYVEKHKLKNHEIVQFNINLLDRINENRKCYKCIPCSYYFNIDDEEPYCPICGGSDIIVIEEENDLSEENEGEQKGDNK